MTKLIHGAVLAAVVALTAPGFALAADWHHHNRHDWGHHHQRHYSCVFRHHHRVCFSR